MRGFVLGIIGDCTADRMIVTSIVIDLTLKPVLCSIQDFIIINSLFKKTYYLLFLYHSSSRDISLEICNSPFLFRDYLWFCNVKDVYWLYSLKLYTIIYTC